MSNPDDTQPSQPEASPPHQPTYRAVPPPAPAAAPPAVSPPAASPPAASPPAAAPPPPPPAPPVPPLPPSPPTAPMAVTPPPGVPPRTVARQARESRRRTLSALAVACFLTLAAVLGYTIGANHDTTSSNASSSFPTQQLPSFGGTSNGSNRTGTSGSSNSQNANIDVQSIAQKVSPSVVNLVSSLNQGEAAGTGIIISSNGLALTNNHVIASSNQLQAEIGGNGDYHQVKVLGYDIEHDVALVQIQDVSGLTPASLGESSSLQVGDAIVALGNAGGKGGQPTVVSGSVTGLGQQITASDQDGSNAETLHNLVQIDANIQPGDSGGALVDANGDVVGMNAAASSGNGGFGFGGGQSANEGYAIPIEDALAIGKKIESGAGGDTIHVGAHAAIIGVAVSDSANSNSSSNGNGFGNSNGNGFGNNSNSNSNSNGNGNGNGNSNGGAYVQDVQSGSGADGVGISQGSYITNVDGNSVTSASQLTHLMVPYQPGDKVKVQWTDSSGQSHSATITLGSGSPS